MKALWKDAFREISKTKTRFISIFAIILLGVAFFAGISATGPVMVETANEYYEDHQLMDLQILSTLGLGERDLELLDDVENATIESFYTTDVILEGSGLATKMMGYRYEEQEINQFDIREGHLPEQAGEIALDFSLAYSEEYELGDAVQIEVGTTDEFEENFNRTEFEVVGFVASPLYIENIGRGNTTIGTGTLDGFAVISEEDFDLEYKTEAYLRFDDTEDLQAYSEEYVQTINQHTDELEVLYADRPEERYAELREEIESELAEGQAEIDDARDQLDDAERELSEARQDLDEGWTSYEEGLEELEQEEQTARQEIADNRQELENGRAQLEQARQELNQAQAEVDEGLEELESQRQAADLDNREQELAAGRQELEQGREELNQAQGEIDANRAQLEEERRLAEEELIPLREAVEALEVRVEDAREALEYTQEQIDQRRAEIEEIYEDASPEEQEQLDVILAGLDRAQEAINQIQELEDDQLIPLQAMLDEAEAEIAQEFQALEEELADAQAELDAARNELERNEQELADGEQQIQQARQEFANAESELQAGQEEINTGRNELSAREEDLLSGEETLEGAEATLEAELADGREELEDARLELEEAEEEYQEGLEEFEEEKVDALAEIEDAEQELADGAETLDELEEPEYFFNNREFFAGYEEFNENADRIESIATIFPVFFFLLAALISLTTMTRMVDEGRTQMGTLKALGYTNIDISIKYFVYAFIATISGGVLGLVIGFAVFPRVIMDAYSSLYNLPAPNFIFYWGYSAVALLGALVATGAATLTSVYSLLKNNTATLLRPKAPKKGQRIFLERIPFIWERFTFTQKVASRNLFRYKRRMLMTIIGVAGCTALLLTGFGLSDSISDISTLQFGEINQYQAMIIENKDASESEIESYEETLSNIEEIEDSLLVHQETATAENNEESQDINVFVPEYAEQFQNFIHLRDVDDTDRTLELPSEGVIITEKLSSLLDVEVGDEIIYVDSDNNSFDVEVAGIAEHYVRHYIYFSPEAYETATSEEAENNARMLTYDSNVIDDDEVAEQLTQEEAVQGIMFVSVVHEAFQDSMDSLDVVTVVLIVSAASLAIVVLYNLTNINVSERIRELSTIKVLGFYDKEVTMYVYRENFVLTTLGILFGLVLGIIMHRFVIITAEIDMMMFSRTINLLSYVYSTLLTFGFSLIVMGIMHFKLKRVDMIEALKTQD